MGKMSEENQAVIIDCGSGYIKTGYGGDDTPRSVFPNVVGIPKSCVVSLISNESNNEKIYVGAEATANSGILDIHYCIQDGLVTNFEYFSNIVRHCYEQELRCNPAEYYCLLTEAPSNPKENRERMFDVVFNEIGPKGLQCQVQAVLSLYASG